MSDIRARIDRLWRLLRPADDDAFATFQAAFLAASPAHQQLFQQAATRHTSASLRVLLRRDAELRDAAAAWCVAAHPGALIRLPLARLIHVPQTPGGKTECRIVVRPERHEDGSEFLQMWLTERQ